MARHVKGWNATHGRDNGKRFIITEAASDQGERFATRLLLALANAGAKLPEGTLEAGMMGVTLSVPALIVTGIRALQGLEYAEIAPLLDEMMTCVKFVPFGQPDVSAVPVEQGTMSQIEEVATRLQLRREIFELHTGFSWAALLSNSKAPASTSDSQPPA